MLILYSSSYLNCLVTPLLQCVDIRVYDRGMDEVGKSELDLGEVGDEEKKIAVLANGESGGRARSEYRRRTSLCR
jgi:hypothetical protein